MKQLIHTILILLARTVYIVILSAYLDLWLDIVP